VKAPWMMPTSLLSVVTGAPSLQALHT